MLGGVVAARRCRLARARRRRGRCLKNTANGMYEMQGSFEAAVSSQIESVSLKPLDFVTAGNNWHKRRAHGSGNREATCWSWLSYP